MAGVMRPLMIFGCAVLFACFLPTASADDDIGSASLLTSGSTVNEYVCYSDGCNPTDERDWWTIYAYTGDVIDVEASGNGNNMNIWCFASDGWEAKVKITNSNGTACSLLKSVSNSIVLPVFSSLVFIIFPE